jgi:hypothetical protein
MARAVFPLTEIDLDVFNTRIVDDGGLVVQRRANMGTRVQQPANGMVAKKAGPTGDQTSGVAKINLPHEHSPKPK